MQILTQNNKKQMICPYCGQTISWNTPEQKTIMGNRTISCSNCGHNFIVPRTELQPFFEKYPIIYTENIYNDGGSSEVESANVTFINSADGFYYDVVIKETTYSIWDSQTITLDLLGGFTIIPYYAFTGVDPEVMPIITGAIEPDQNGFKVAGDGTITIAGLNDK